MGQTFWLAGQIQTMKSTTALRKNLAYFKPKTGQIKAFSYKIMPKIYIYSLLKEPQKMFGGPHFVYNIKVYKN